MIQFAQTDNVTWDYLPIGYWSAVEAHVGVIIACLPAIRQLQRSIRERIWPKPKTANSNYYEENSRDSSKRNGSKGMGSRYWLSKADRSQLSTLGRSKVDKEDFVRLDEYEMGARGAGAKNAVIAVGDPAQNGSDGSLDRSFKSNEDVQPLAAATAPVIGSPVVGSPFGRGIMGQSEYTCTINRGTGS